MFLQIFNFLILQKEVAFIVSPKKMYFVVRKVSGFSTNDWSVARQLENIYDATRCKVILASIANETLFVLNKQAFGAEFLEAVAILLSIEGTNVLTATPTGT